MGHSKQKQNVIILKMLVEERGDVIYDSLNFETGQYFKFNKPNDLGKNLRRGRGKKEKRADARERKRKELREC